MAKMNPDCKPREVDLEPQDPIPELRLVEFIPPRDAVVPAPTDSTVEHPNGPTPPVRNKAARRRPKRPVVTPFDNSAIQFSSDISSWPEAVWDWLLKDSERVARYRLRDLHWRGAGGGVLPRGFDANSLAAEAIAGLLGRISVREFAFDPELPASRIQQVAADLRQRVRRLINNLWHLKEQRIMVNAPDLDTLLTDDGETISILETIRAPEPGPAEELATKEERAELARVKQEVLTFLGEDELLKNLFTCHCDGVTKRAAIARRLQAGSNVVKNAQKRLERRVLEFRRQKIF